MTIHFDCTQCGKCCQNLRLTLSVDEAIGWAGRGHTVQLLTEALPWVSEPDTADARVLYDRDRSFPAMSGSVAFRIAAVPVAHHIGPCPNLQPDMRCSNYEQRPRICRIYPLESRPFIGLDPASRLCPPEAWAPAFPVLERNGKIADTETANIVAEHRRTAVDDVPVLTMACHALGVSTAAFANEGFAVHTFDPQKLAEALRAVRDANPNQNAPAPQPWTVATNRRSTLTMLAGAGCEAALVQRGADYLGSFPDEP
ncbi:YkgJ family cysteine cluster protein [Novosphingobium album (ex Hu et al. 2023)]|uniref:YkgJ family cysteine cluster protein n=1 Tax=Novosphingobium album (ex Hu et al. 2023) TaxID=2930093 RepID=A0ABT0B168_9SPHN|nr:YkgJ family cysteine cluster protein [Novosphingobium album (ex Hu et al. 2023)]MCJ2178802.1 YkgJ family cysteine cluster protein [Novosphingobium album (ex Hu et al. 2023)]